MNAGGAGATGSIPESGRSLGGGNGNTLHYSCLGNPMDRGAWWATVHRVAKSQTQLTTHSVLPYIFLTVLLAISKRSPHSFCFFLEEAVKRKGARGPKPSAGGELSQVGFPKFSWPPDFPCRPLGALCLWLSGTSGKAGFSLAPGLVLLFFQVLGPGGWGSLQQLN